MIRYSPKMARSAVALIIAVVSVSFVACKGGHKPIIQEVPTVTETAFDAAFEHIREFSLPGVDPSSIIDATVDSFGNLYILDSQSLTITRVTAGRSLAAKAGGAGSGPGKLNRPFRIAVFNNNLIVLDARPPRVNIYNAATGAFEKSFLYHVPRLEGLAGIALAPWPKGGFLIGAFIPDFRKQVDLVYQFDDEGALIRSFLPRAEVVNTLNLHLHAGVDLRGDQSNQIYAVQPASPIVYRLHDAGFEEVVSSPPEFYRPPIPYPEKYLADDPRIQEYNRQWTRHYAAFPLDRDRFLDVFFVNGARPFALQVYTAAGKVLHRNIFTSAKPLSTDGNGSVFLLQGWQSRSDTTLIKIYRVRWR
jgi:hypothetical protein